MNPRLFANLKSWVVGESVLDGIKAIAVKKLTAPRAAPARSSIADETDRGSDDGTSSNPDVGGEYGFASGFTLESQFIESPNNYYTDGRQPISAPQSVYPGKLAAYLIRDAVYFHFRDPRYQGAT